MGRMNFPAFFLVKYFPQDPALFPKFTRLNSFLLH